MVSEPTFSIKPVSSALDSAIWEKINQKTKPVGALGKLEDLAFRIGRIQQTLEPLLLNPTIIVFAGDHGISKSGLVNPYPQEVTHQMVLNLLQGGAAINVLTEEQGMLLKIVDAGVNVPFRRQANLIIAKMGRGTEDYRFNKAMSLDTCKQAVQRGGEVVSEIADNNTNIIGFGEMGIGNTSSAALIMSAVCGLPISDCVGRGTGADDHFLKQKITTLQQVAKYHQLTSNDSPYEILATYGGFEIAQMVGGMLYAASKGHTILVDGFISTVALLQAECMNPAVTDYAIFTHQSEEKGHVGLLEYLKADPVLNLGMRLGEGTGCAAVYPLLTMATAFLNRMASFETAGVSKRMSE